MVATSETGGTVTRGTRADAVRNRAAILRAAAGVFAQRGHEVDVREIARCAGVGMGTLYRHFPTKQVLVETVLREDFLAWTRSARQAAASHPDPWDALSAFLTDALSRHACHRAMLERFADTWDPSQAAAEWRAQLTPVIAEIVARCHTAGVLRAGVTSDDIALALICLGRLVQLTDPASPALWHRHLQIYLDGLRAGHDQPLPLTRPAPDG